MKKKIPWDEVAFLLAVLAFVAYYFLSVQGYGNRAVLWPYVLLVATVVAVVAVAFEVLSKAPVAETTDETEKKSLKEALKGETTTFVTIGAFIVYIMLLKKAGMHLCNFCLSFFLTLYYGKGKWKTALLLAAVLTLTFYLVFGVALGIRLPKCKLFK